MRGECRCVGQVGRGDHHLPAPGLGEPCRSRHDQLQFADAGAFDVNFGDDASGPARAGQMRVELGVAGGHAGGGDWREIIAAPDGGVVEHANDGL